MDGQRFIGLLRSHPWFEVAAVTGSERRVGRCYLEAVNWKLESPLENPVGELEVLPTEPKAVKGVDIAFSALPSEVAAKAEEEFARAGFMVVSNASSHRMDLDVPLVVPEVNPDHISLIDDQRQKRGWDGAIITNPNCTATPLVMSLKPLVDKFGVKRVIVSTMQASSGAGYPGVASLDLIDNIIPYIRNEEEKVAEETCKMLGSKYEPASILVSASCHRVPVLDGHTEAVFVETEKTAEPSEVSRAMENFRAEPQLLKLPTAPPSPIVLRTEEDRPQPRLDRMAGQGMSVVVGRIRRDKALNGIKYVLLGHNTVRGAAGCAILTAEYLKAKRYL